jgi:hypothetical protein
MQQVYRKRWLQVNTAFSPLIPLWKQRTASLPVNKQAVLAQILSVLNAELAALTRAGAHVLPSESVFYALLGHVRHPFFKTYTQLVKSHG